jgi:hypothetical protein
MGNKELTTVTDPSFGTQTTTEPPASSTIPLCEYSSLRLRQRFRPNIAPMTYMIPSAKKRDEAYRWTHPLVMTQSMAF